MSDLEQLSAGEVAALAGACLLIDDARLYGLIAGGPDVDRDQCQAILDRLARDGVVPSTSQVEQVAIELLEELIHA